LDHPLQFLKSIEELEIAKDTPSLLERNNALASNSNTPLKINQERDTQEIGGSVVLGAKRSRPYEVYEERAPDRCKRMKMESDSKDENLFVDLRSRKSIRQSRIATPFPLLERRSSESIMDSIVPVPTLKRSESRGLLQGLKEECRIF